MKAIVAVDKGWGIGYQGKLLEHIPEDMKYFREKTVGKVVVMGRETFESLPGKKPLKNRVNIVLSRKNDFMAEGIVLCKSLNGLFEVLKTYPPDDIFVIGGQDIYTQLIPYCDEAYVTKIDKQYLADKLFIDLDEHPNWKLTWESETHVYNGIEFKFTKYANQSVADFNN